MTGFYPIIDASLVPPSKIDRIAKTVIQGGARIIQLRGKALPTQDLIRTAKSIRQVAEENNAVLIINDRVDIAVLADADGVHLGQDDLPIEDARRILGRQKIIGISTHNEDEAKDAQIRGADYISFGPIFATKTKKDAQGPKGTEKLKELRRCVSIPVAAIGGITLKNAGAVYEAGADCIAVISALLEYDDIKKQVGRFIKLNQ